MGRHKNAAPDFSFQARWGDPVVDGGIAPIPMVFLNNYTKLGISPNQGMAIIHAFSYKWTAEDPFPSMGTIAGLMGKSRRQVIRYFNDLEERGFLIKTERRAENGSLLSCILNFKPLLEVCMTVDQENRDRHAERGGDMDVTRGVVSPMSHETEEVPEEKTVQTAATPPAAVTASPPEKQNPLGDTHAPNPSSASQLQKADLIEQATEELQPEEIAFLNSLNLTPEQRRRVAEMTPLDLRAHLNTAANMMAQRNPETSKLKDPAEEICTVEDIERWAHQIGYRNIQREIKFLGAMVVLSKVLAFERAARHGEIKAHNKAGYFNWMLRNAPLE